MPLISIIVPIYNAAKSLHRCIDSILTQTYTDFELILVDDGSKDNSGMICDEYAKRDERVKVYHKENGGVSSARNLRLEGISGDFVAFIDSDDWIKPDFLEQMNIASSGADMVICEMAYERDGKVIYSDNSLAGKDKIAYLKYQILYGFTSVCNCMFSRELVNTYNLRFEAVRYSEDFIFSLKAICLATSIKYVDAPLYHYNRNNESSALHKYPDNMHKDLLYCDSLMIAFFKEKGVFEELKREYYWHVLRIRKELVLAASKHSDFKHYIPESNAYILSCPLVNFKLKIMMCLLICHLDILVKVLIFTRKLLGRN